ncbi:unnamed protein product, partial [Mesorhabditis belari]|uniref:Uncharacterized protein n=1 Tax=Mesorhabditis belari TaxID=2138241 RepID=A0AAF3J2X1_9BILA
MKILLFFLLFSSIFSLKVLQVTDFHLDIDYSINGDPKAMCHQAKKTRDSDANQLGTFGDYMCDAPELLVNYVVSEAQRLVPNPDLILWTGDNTPHIEGYDMDYVLNGITKTTKLLFTAFPNVPILPTFGNHDYSPSNDFVEESSLYKKTYDTLWSEKVGAENRDRFLKGGYYQYRIPKTKQLVLVLNTNLYYVYNQAAGNFSNPFDPAEQFNYMEAALSAAKSCTSMRKNQRFGDADCANIVHIVAHIGPGAFERTPNITWMTPYYNNQFLAILEKYSSNVGWMIFGHHHTDTFHVVRDYTGAPFNVAWMAPAVTPWFSTLDGAGSNNPTFRVYQTDDNTGEILDFTTYSLDLEKLNANGNESAKVEYSMKDAYSLQSLHPQSISDLVDQFEKSDELFLKYITYNSAGWGVKLPEGKFKQAQLCSLRFADYERYFRCMETDQSTITTTTKTYFTTKQWTYAFLLFFISTTLCQYSDDFGRNTVWPLAVATFDKNPQICIKSGLPDGQLRRKLEMKCDLVNETCSGYTAFSQASKVIVLAFRGSEGTEVPMEVLSVLFEKQAQFPGGGLVAEFFYRAFLGIWNAGMKDDFLTLRQQFPDYQVWITGHSLGAAMATLAAGFITQNGYVSGTEIKLITYGEPRNGDATYASRINDMLPFAYRVVHDNDIVPQIPLDLENYEHHRTEIWYPNAMAVGDPFVVCRGNEDRNCSAGLPLLKWNTGAHTLYFNIDIGKYQRNGCIYS